MHLQVSDHSQYRHATHLDLHQDFPALLLFSKSNFLVPQTWGPIRAFADAFHMSGVGDYLCGQKALLIRHKAAVVPWHTWVNWEAETSTWNAYTMKTSWLAVLLIFTSLCVHPGHMVSKDSVCHTLLYHLLLLQREFLVNVHLQESSTRLLNREVILWWCFGDVGGIKTVQCVSTPDYL